MLTQRQLFLSHVAQTSPAPLAIEVERAEGVWLHQTNGKKLLDLISGIAVSNIGHSHPEVVKAVQQQAARYMHLMVYGEFVETPQVQYAKRLTENLPASLNSVYFTNSGTEATEGAMKLAKRYTGRTQIISFVNSYHGSTQGALSLMGDEAWKRNFRPLLPDVLQLEYGDVASLQNITSRTAAVFCEPIQAESGVTIPSTAFIQQLRQVCSHTQALLVFDEAQTGLGRTGKLFALEHFNAVPDVLLLAKAFGGGMPLGAFIASGEVMNCLTENPVLGHITTFGGHPVSCAAGLAAFEVLLREDLLQQVAVKGRLLDELLQHPAIKSKRGIGLMFALEFDSFETNKHIIDHCIENGVLTDWFLFAPHCMRIAPPLTISEEEIRFACKVIQNAIEEHDV